MLRILPRLVLFASFLGALALAPHSARAQEWAVDKANTQITFEGSAGGQTITGTFREYQIEVRMDPDEPKEAEVTAAIDMSSVSTGQPQADQALNSAEWFDPSNYPVAELRATSAKFTTNDNYELRADLKIKGTVKRLAVPFTLEVRNGEAKARAEFVVNRSDFRVGPAGPVSGMVIGDTVKIVVTMAAKRLDN